MIQKDKAFFQYSGLSLFLVKKLNFIYAIKIQLALGKKDRWEERQSEYKCHTYSFFQQFIAKSICNG